MTSTFWKDSEYLICGSYDGKISIWEISSKSNNNDEGSATITPQLRSVIDNTKVTGVEKYADERPRGNEILVIKCWSPPYVSPPKSDFSEYNNND